MQLQLKSCTRKKAYMDRICGSGDDGSCKTRIHTVIRACRTYKDEWAKTGNATRKKNPAFFDEMDELFVRFCRALLSALVVRCELDDNITMFN